MKVLTPLLALLVLCSSLISEDMTENNNTLDKYISKYKKEQFNYDYEKNEAESSKLRDTWIDPLFLNYSYQVSEAYGGESISQKKSIKFDQKIFQSGGIYFGIKYAEASRRYANYSIDVAKRKMVKEAVSLLMQIKQTSLKIKKQKLQIKNSEISLSQKKEQYLSGQLDSGFLDNAVIERNFVIQSLYDIETAKERLISTFHAISDLDYQNVLIPKLEIIEIKDFLTNNIVLKFTKSDIEKTQNLKNVTIAKYLPEIRVQAGYNWDSLKNPNFGGTTVQTPKDTAYLNYGFRVSMPLDVKSFNDMESTRVDYLKSQIVLEDKKRELQAIYEQVMQNIENFDKKKLLSLENKEIYTKLLNETKELFSAGYKTEYDVGLLENSVAISEIDYQIFEIDKQLELLTLYEMYKKEY